MNCILCEDDRVKALDPARRALLHRKVWAGVSRMIEHAKEFGAFCIEMVQEFPEVNDIAADGETISKDLAGFQDGAHSIFACPFYSSVNDRIALGSGE